jgi:hypothetical protein
MFQRGPYCGHVRLCAVDLVVGPRADLTTSTAYDAPLADLTSQACA